jgi:hypothetical protein
MGPSNLFLKIAFPASLLATMSGCDKDLTKISQRLTPDAVTLHQWFDSSTDALKQHFTLNSSADAEIIGEQGTILQFSANDFTLLNGDPVTGSVDVELIEVYDRASMLLTKTSTNGKTKNGSISTLISGGEFYVNAKQDGTPLKLKSGFTIVAPAENTGTINQDMTKFDGIDSCAGDDCDLVWEEAEDRGIEIGEWQTAGGVKTVYYVFQNKFGWTNIDRWYNDPRPKTTIFVEVPEGFDNTNCSVYMMYDNEPVALASFDMYDQNKKLFTEHYGLIPVGLEVHFILVSIIDDEIHYAIQGATITENHVAVIESVKAISEEKLIDLIYELP